jgi:hypothetical protein
MPRIVIPLTVIWLGLPEDLRRDGLGEYIYLKMVRSFPAK